jgi:hypothetical protein
VIIKSVHFAADIIRQKGLRSYRMRTDKKPVERRRRIIFNNDGCDVIYFPAGTEPTPENLLALRTSPLVGTQVDTIFYCPISAGFSLFTHNTRVGEVLKWDIKRDGKSLQPDMFNIAGELIKTGTDSLQVMTDFGHRHNIEIFFSMRMNDTHDAAHTQDSPYPLFPALKKEHPEYLIGSQENRPPYGAWSAVNYAVDEIRELAFRFLEEVCENYDIDGIELDFFRHPVFFKNPAYGRPATNGEIDMMTSFMKRIRRMSDEAGKRRGRPILIAVRTPDSVEYCRMIGLDLKSWMQERLLDIFIPSGYFRLNPWEYSAKIAHTCGIKVYAGLSESRVGGGHHKDARRASDECYRARATNALSAGADGVYIFNLFDPSRKIWNEIGSLETLKHLDKKYFVTVRGRKKAAGGNYPYDDFNNLPTVTPDEPLIIKPGETAKTEITCHENTSNLPEIILTLRFKEQIQSEDVSVRFNGIRFEKPICQENKLVFAVPQKIMVQGKNRIELTVMQSGEAILEDAEISVRYKNR